MKKLPAAPKPVAKIGPLKRAVFGVLKLHRELLSRDQEELSQIQQRMRALQEAAQRIAAGRTARYTELLELAQEEHGKLEVPAGHHVVDMVEGDGTYLVVVPIEEPKRPAPRPTMKHQAPVAKLPTEVAPAK